MVDASGGVPVDLKRGWDEVLCRGVDVSQIRRQLRMTERERVRTMVEAANTMVAIRERSGGSIRRER